MDDELTKTLKYLRLSGLLAHWDQYLALARQQRFSHVRLLRYVLEEEFKIRSENARKLRLARARIPELFLRQIAARDLHLPAVQQAAAALRNRCYKPQSRQIEEQNSLFSDMWRGDAE